MQKTQGSKESIIIHVEVVYGGTDSRGLDAAYKLLAKEVWDRAQCEQQYISESVVKSRRSMDTA